MAVQFQCPAPEMARTAMHSPVRCTSTTGPRAILPRSALRGFPDPPCGPAGCAGFAVKDRMAHSSEVRRETLNPQPHEKAGGQPDKEDDDER